MGEGGEARHRGGTGGDPGERGGSEDHGGIARRQIQLRDWTVGSGGESLKSKEPAALRRNIPLCPA